jgi:hypothetical protein
VGVLWPGVVSGRFLTIDIPQVPLFKDSMGGIIIPQVRPAVLPITFTSVCLA